MRAKFGLSAQAVESLQTANSELGEVAAAVDTVELEDLGQTAKKTSDAVCRMETALTDAHVDELPGTLDDPRLNLCEIQGLDKTLQTTQGELTNNLPMLTALDDHIAYERQKLDTEGIDEFSRCHIADCLQDLLVERSARLDAATANREALHSQINCMCKTINHILHEDTTLAEWVCTLFREQGVTLPSMFTAIGMAISTLVLALSGGASGGHAVTPPPPPTDKGGLREWAKKMLQALGRVLAKLAGKAAVAPPGIIGSIVSWLLSTLGKATRWLAEHLWALVVGVIYPPPPPPPPPTHTHTHTHTHKGHFVILVILR